MPSGDYRIPMSQNSNGWTLLLLLAVFFAPGCQRQEQQNPLAFRGEVEEGTPGAVYIEDFVSEYTAPGWFGPARRFDLARVGNAKDSSGRGALFFEIVQSEKEAFGDFTESLIDLRMAIEIEGTVYSAPHVEGRLTSGGVITGGMAGFSKEEVVALLKVLERGVR